MSSSLTRVNSVQFKKSQIPEDCTLDELKPKFGKYILLERKEEGKGEILDAILIDKVGFIFSNSYATVLSLVHIG